MFLFETLGTEYNIKLFFPSISELGLNFLQLKYVMSTLISTQKLMLAAEVYLHSSIQLSMCWRYWHQNFVGINGHYIL